MNYIASYLAEVQTALHSVPLADVERVADLLWDNYINGRRVVFCGNGGSAATASHLPSDLQKNMTQHGARAWECLSLADSVPLITAWGNDTEFANVFAGQARVWLRPKDMLLAVSGSGNSPNILAAAQAAHDCGALCVALCGFGGGKLAEMADAAIVLQSTNMQVVEDVHMTIGHALYVALRERLLAQLEPHMTTPQDDDTNDALRPEYRFDYRQAQPNRFAAPAPEPVVVTLDADVAAAFPNTEAVNNALRALINTPPAPSA